MRHALARLLPAALCFVGGAALAQDYVPINLQLLSAARTGDVATVQRLLDDGAAINSRNRLGETPLLVALKRGHDALALWLVEHGADVRQASLTGTTPLMSAAFDGKTDIARLLLERGADATAVDRVKKPAMVYAAGNGHTAIVAMLLDRGIDVNLRYPGDQTALNHPETTELLLARGADPGLRDDRGWTAAQQARANGHEAIAARLESKQPR
jgi:ankyrin repeat protein